MGHKWPCSGTPMNGLKNRCFYFEVAFIIEGVPQTLNHFGSLDKRFFELRIHYQIHVAHSVTGFGVAKRIVHISFGVLLWQRQWI